MLNTSTRLSAPGAGVPGEADRGSIPPGGYPWLSETNTGLKHISQGEHGQSYNELIYTRRRYIHQEHLRAAIIDVANAIFQVRQPHIWGEGTTTCASDSTQFGAWGQNFRNR